MAWLRENLSGDQFQKQYSELITKCKEILSGNLKVISGLWESREFNYGYNED